MLLTAQETLCSGRKVRRVCFCFHKCSFICLKSVCVAAGEELGDLFEVSTIRREDYEFHKGKSEYEEILQSNNLPSSATPRGHQTPAAFLIMASGLDKVDKHKMGVLIV